MAENENREDPPISGSDTGTAPKKSVAKKTTAKKTAAKKSIAKKATAKKATAKKVTAKKATAKKVTAKKATVKKAVKGAPRSEVNTATSTATETVPASGEGTRRAMLQRRLAELGVSADSSSRRQSPPRTLNDRIYHGIVAAGLVFIIVVLIYEWVAACSRETPVAVESAPATATDTVYKNAREQLARLESNNVVAVYEEAKEKLSSKSTEPTIFSMEPGPVTSEVSSIRYGMGIAEPGTFAEEFVSPVAESKPFVPPEPIGLDRSVFQPWNHGEGAPFYGSTKLLYGYYPPPQYVWFYYY